MEIAFEDFNSFVAHARAANKPESLSESEILEKLKELDIRTDKTQFVKEVEGHISAYEFSEKWRNRLSPVVDVLDEDFPLLAAQELWDRWLQDQF